MLEFLRGGRNNIYEKIYKERGIMKKLLSIMIALCMLVGIFATTVSVSADEEPVNLLAGYIDGTFESYDSAASLTAQGTAEIVSDAHSGEKAMKVTGHDWCYYWLNILADLDNWRGKTYCLSYWYKADGLINIQVWDQQADSHNAINQFDGTTDTWTLVELNFTIDDTWFATDDTQALLRVGFEVGAGVTLYIDDYSLVEVEPEVPADPEVPYEPNPDDILLPWGFDGSFESYTTPNALNGYGNGTNEIVTGIAHTGVQSLKMTGHDWCYHWLNIFSDLNNWRGKTFCLTYWYKTDAAEGVMNIQAWDQQAQAQNAMDQFNVTSGEWVEKSLTFTIDDTWFAENSEAALLRVGLEVGGGVTAYIDDISLVEVEPETPDTGDNTMFYIAVVMFIVMLAGSVALSKQRSM